MQVILGGGGAIGTELAKGLKSYTSQIRIVGRNPQKVNDSDETFAAELTDGERVDAAVAGASVVYLVAGLPYNIRTWRAQWPLVMQHVIDACKKHGARLVFFDNVYPYAADSLGHLTEESRVDPPSKKGKVRAAIAAMLWEEMKKGSLQAMIVRAADFYGPGIRNSVLLETVYTPLKKGKKAIWLGRNDKIHSFTYTPDAARATALLGNTPDAFNQVWHLPTSDEKLTGGEWVKLFAGQMHTAAKFMTISRPFIRIMGLFQPLMREMVEMMYQNEQDYFFDSTKFKNRFPDFQVTSYEEGVREVLKS